MFAHNTPVGIAVFKPALGVTGSAVITAVTVPPRFGAPAV
jgi:hypothetical protein